MKGHPQQRRRLKSSSTALGAAVLTLAALLWRLRWQRAEAIWAAGSSDGGQPSILFQCPDGRLGLHVVHTRFLISQAQANLVFQASRLQLMTTFLLPSLLAQTSQNFVLYAAHDPDLTPLALRPFTDALAFLGRRSFVSGERKTTMKLDYAALAARLERVDPRVRHVDLFVTSRVDLDDAAHVGAVAGVQQHACAGGRSEAEAVRLVYITSNGVLWSPSDAAYGVVRAPRPIFNVYRHLAIMQSMVLSGAAVLRACPLNVYSYPHYKPQQLEKKRTAGCGARFDAEKNVLRWAPPEGDYGWLYTKTASGWTYGKINHKISTVLIGTDVSALERSFGVQRAALAAANLLFRGYETEAVAAMGNSTSLQLER